MKLQNNFTTPEQSKRLLEIGVPADSADMAYRALNGKCYSNDMCGWSVIPSVIFIAKPNWDKHEWYPCWSVGRLIEIYDICRCYDGDWDEVYAKETLVETYVSAIEEAVLDKMLDFSKLEE